MRFLDLTIEAGRVRSRRMQVSEELVPTAVDLCREMLSRLLSGEDWVPHGQEGLPPFEVSLGLPDEMAILLKGDTGDPEGIFCVRLPGADLPFQFNAVLPGGQFGMERAKCLTSILGLSLSVDHNAALPAEDEIQQLVESAPLLATTVLPFGIDPRNPLHQATIRIAADFCTCFAAAMLTRT